MNFYLSERGPLNSTFAAENGQIIYKVNTPMRLGTRTSTISKIMPNDVVLHQEDEGEGEVDMRDRFALCVTLDIVPSLDPTERSTNGSWNDISRR